MINSVTRTVPNTTGDTARLRRIESVRMTPRDSEADGNQHCKPRQRQPEIEELKILRRSTAPTRTIPSRAIDHRAPMLSCTVATSGRRTLTLNHARAASRQHAGAAGYTYRSTLNRARLKKINTTAHQTHSSVSPRRESVDFNRQRLIASIAAPKATMLQGKNPPRNVEEVQGMVVTAIRKRIRLRDVVQIAGERVLMNEVPAECVIHPQEPWQRKTDRECRSGFPAERQQRRAAFCAACQTAKENMPRRARRPRALSS